MKSFLRSDGIYTGYESAFSSYFVVDDLFLLWN